MSKFRTADEMRALYDRTSRHYDAASSLYKITGVEAHRSRLIADMHLPEGGTVLDLGTGTGVNLERLAGAVGPRGKVIGVDLSPGMLAKAKAKTGHMDNIELVECDLRTYQFPDQVDGIISTFALEFVPEYADVLRRATDALAPGAPLALMGLKYPDRWPGWLADFGIWLNRSFGVTRKHRHNKPWIAAEKLVATGAIFGAAFRFILCLARTKAIA